MQKSNKITALALGLIATLAMAAAVAAPAGAASYTGIKVAKFKVEVEGTQKVIQQHTHSATDPCDVEDRSSGSETLTFSSKPIVVTATYIPGQANPEFFAGKRLGIPTKAKVKRSYTPRLSVAGGASCGENGGGAEATKPDCGTKVVQPWLVNLQFTERPRKDQLLLTSNSGDGDPFQSCPGAGPAGFPYLIVNDSHAKFIAAQLSQDELFDPHFQKWISIANGTDKETSPDYWTKTTVQWSVSFTRLKGK